MNEISKSEEIEVLRTAVKKLGENSYCGKWLEQQIPFIESDIRSDLYPTVSYNESKAIVAREIAEGQRVRDESIAEGNRKRQILIADAMREAEAIKAHARKLLESNLRNLMGALEQAKENLFR